MDDEELAAMSAVVHALGGLDAEIRTRVLRYALDRFDVPNTSRAPPPRGSGARKDSSDDVGGNGAIGGPGDWKDFGDLYYAYRPSSNSEKVLVAGYWLQAIEGADSFKSHEANKLLKDMGEQIPKNVQRDLQRLIDEKPSRVILQSGSGQGRKKYKLTKPGLDSVVRRATGTGQEDE